MPNQSIPRRFTTKGLVSCCLVVRRHHPFASEVTSTNLFDTFWVKGMVMDVGDWYIIMCYPDLDCDLRLTIVDTGYCCCCWRWQVAAHWLDISSTMMYKLYPTFSLAFSPITQSLGWYTKRAINFYNSNRGWFFCNSPSHSCT